MVRAELFLIALLLLDGLQFVQLLLPSSLQLGAVLTPLANLPAFEAFVTARAPASRLHRRGSTGYFFSAVAAGARQIADIYLVYRPSDSLQVDVAVALALDVLP